MVKKYGTSCHTAFTAIREDKHPNNRFAKTVLDGRSYLYSIVMLYCICHIPQQEQTIILLSIITRIWSDRETLNSRKPELCLEDSILKSIAGYKV